MFDKLDKWGYCDEQNAFAFSLPSEFGKRIAIILPMSACLMTTFGLISFKMGRHTLASFLILIYGVLIGSFGVGWTCMTWIAYVDFALLSVVLITLVIFWSRPSFFKPGGVLQSLMFSRIKNHTGDDQDTILFGKPSDYDFTYGQTIYIIAYIFWCVAHVVERYDFYTSIGYNKTLAMAKALPHAAIRLHWFAEASGQRYYVIWGCTGMSYERLMAVHKIAGRVFFPIVLAHLILIMATFSEHKNVPGHKIGDPINFDGVNAIFGFLAFFMLIGLIATSTPSMRRKSFENFYWNHFNFKFLMMLFMLFHMRQYVLPFTITLVFGFYFDMTLRFISKAMYTCTVEEASIVCNDTATSTEIAKFVITRSTWPGGPWNHEAGDYVMLSFGSKSKANQPITKWLNPLSFKETLPVGGPPLPPAMIFHPYTIASPPDAASNKLTFYIKNMGPGTWSDQVCSMARPDSGCDIKLLNPHVGGSLGRLSIKPSEYETILLCAGGIGVTPMAAIWSDIAKKHAVGATKKVIVVWAAPTAKIFAAFRQEIDMTARNTTGVKFEFKLFVTRGTAEDGDVDFADGDNVQVKFGGRPDWIEEVNAAAVASSSGYCGVFACGPPALMTGVTAATVQANGGKKSNVSPETGGGKVHLHKETFEF